LKPEPVWVDRQPPPAEAEVHLVSTFRLEPEHFHLTTGTFNLLSKTDPHFRLSGAFSVRANPLRNLCVLETFQSYRAPATAVNPLLAQDFHLFSTVRGVSIQSCFEAKGGTLFTARPKTRLHFDQD
jgi:hypothetical protein